MLILLNCFKSFFFRENVSKQIDSVQADLENLLKGLNDKYTFDANMFLNVSNFILHILITFFLMFLNFLSSSLMMIQQI